MQLLLMHNLGVLTLVLLPFSLLRSQNTDSEDFMSDQYHTTDVLENNVDLTQIVDLQQESFSELIDINTAIVEDFLKIQILTLQQINELILHRSNFGKFICLEELQCLPSWDFQTLTAIRPFFCVDENNNHIFNWRSMLKDPKMTWSLKTRINNYSNISRNYKNHSSGIISPYQWTFKYSLVYHNSIKLNILAEQDIGEQFFGLKSKYGFDFYAASIQLIKPVKWCSELIIGDFIVGLGQGLIRHHDFGGNKSSQVMAIKKSARRIKPYNSIQENNSLRGLAITLPIQKNISLLGYFSARKKDASIVYDTLLQVPLRFSTFQLSGLHRTEKEVKDKDAIWEIIGGFNIDYKFRTSRLSLNCQTSHFDVPMLKEAAMYRTFHYSGNNLQQFSFDYSTRFRNITTFGELALSQWKGKALVQGFLMTLDRYTDLSSVFRYYSKDYQSLNASAFGDASSPSNEYGLYLGVCLRPFKNVEINIFADHWVNKWLTYRRNGSAYARDYMLRFNFQKRKHYAAYIQYRFVSKPINHYNETAFNTSSPVSYSLHKIRAHINVLLDKTFEFRSRIEWSNYNHVHKKVSGILIYQDIMYHPLYATWNCALRLSIYDVGSFDSRIYAYEHSVSQESSIPFYQGKGARLYIVLKNKIGKHIKLELKYAKDYITKQQIYLGEFNKPQGYATGELIAQVLVSM